MTTQTMNTVGTSADQQPLSFVRILLHTEGLSVLIGALVLYGLYSESPWWMIPALFLVPDLALIPYMINRRVGTVVYNLVHHYGFAVALGVSALVLNWSFGVTLALIWFIHIATDRTVGYGFKYGDGELKETHIQRA